MLKVNLLSLFIFIFNENFLVESKKLLFTNSLNDFDNIDIECPENCLNQKCNNETLKCIECIDGYYSDKCDKECPIDHCIKCKQDDGECIDCDSNYHLVYNYCCDTNCNLCDVNGCLDCASKEKYGEECVDCPNTCDDNGDQRKCDQSTGKCFKCKMGKRGDYCTDNCNLGCDISEINCAKEDGKCDCKNGYFGETCDEECDKNCKNCNKNDGICNECESKYYINPDDKKQCIKCPQNCDGECPMGICEKCISGLFGDTCEEACSENCVNKRCDKNTGKCECINFYSEESNCSECENFFDLNTNCAECITNYDRETNCTQCKGNYDLKKECKECKEHYSLQSDCTKCINHFDINYNCEKCENHYDIKSDCTICEANYDIKSLCKNCFDNYNLTENCEKCINHFDISSGCKTCLVGYFDFQCNKKCFEGCNTTIENCKQNDGKCENCIRGYYNDYCSQKCNEHCLGEPYICDPKTGECEKCEPLYYGKQCENEAKIAHCKEVNKTGECIKCEDTYYLLKGECIKCSSNCTDSLCEDITGQCFSCLNINSYGKYCEQICSKFCQKNETNYICNRDSGSCYYGCVSTGNFSDEKCENCEQGFYPIEDGCNLECSDNCEDKLGCRQEDGSCTACKIGFWGEQCTKDCDVTCEKRECQREDGTCSKCIDGYYKSKNNKCEKCPPNCNTCTDENKCTSCIENFYGENKCEKRCSSHCQGKSCEIKDGKCNCESKYFGEGCSSECNGCSENGCEDKEGICVDHYCLDNYYDPRKCDKECSKNCLGEKCDIFTGECISCPENKWGKNCDKVCSSECKDDGRLDCCYTKEQEYDNPRGIEIDMTYKTDNINKNLKEEQKEFSFIYLTLGGFELKILADFETNSPLVVFDYDTTTTPIETEIYRINYNKTYVSSSTDCIKGQSANGFYEYDGFFLTKEINAKDTLKIKDHIFTNFSFLICQEFVIEKDFDNAGTIDGVIGLGLRNHFAEDLFYNKEGQFPKNILIKFYDEQKKITSIYFGDYHEKIKNNFSKLSTLIIENKQEIGMYNLIHFETKFTGIAYSLRKAYHYQYDKKVILNNRIETTIVFNNLYQQFFEKIYFGDLYENGCYFKNLQGGEKEYYCEKSKKSQIQNLPKLGLILGDYIYYLSFNFLYKESEDYFTFIIKLHGQGQQKIELGKSFFNEFSIIYNNGNETLNFYGDIKKLNVPLRDPSNLLNIDSDIFTPGGWVTLIVFITVIIIIFCYLIKYCGEKTYNEDDEEDDIDYEEDSLIDDTLE
jgi:hypothetical protein